MSNMAVITVRFTGNQCIYIIIYIFCLNCGGVVRDVQKSWLLVSANDMWHAAADACGPAFSYNMYIIMNYPQGWNFGRILCNTAAISWYFYKTCFIFISPLPARRPICLMLYYKIEIFKFSFTEIAYLLQYVSILCV